MKQLYLVRHAKSSWEQDWLDDFERPLNQRGKRDAPKMGRILREQGVVPDIILTSPAARASATARIIARELDYPLDLIHYHEKLYEAMTRDFITTVAALDNQYNSAMLFGHNPSLTMVANMYSGESIVNVPTTGVVGIEFGDDSWVSASENRGRFLFFEYPKKH